MKDSDNLFAVVVVILFSTYFQRCPIAFVIEGSVPVFLWRHIALVV